MRAIFVLAFVVAAAAAQDGVCECGIFIRESFGMPIPHGPIHNYPSVGVDCNSGADDVNCQFNCSVYFRYTINEVDWDEDYPDGNGTWGQYICHESFEVMGWTTDDPDDLRCMSTYTEARYRMEGCGGPGRDWIPAIQETKDFCCDQMAQYIPNCPPEPQKHRNKPL